MASADRQSTNVLADRLLSQAKNFNLFRLMEQLHGLHSDNIEDTESLAPERYRLRLNNYAGLGFPASDVVHAGHSHNRPGHYMIQASFFGLHGPDSPLPCYYLDKIAWEYGQDTGLRPAFLNFFNHRLLTLLYLGFRKYRYYLRFRREASDRFSRYVFALIGLWGTELRGETQIPWSRLLSYVGLIASRGRSPSMVSGILAHCFDLKTVHIREFELRIMDIPRDQQLSLGCSNGRLCDNFIIGSRIRTRHSKFTIVIAGLTQQRFRDFLPNGNNFGRLRTLMDFLLRDPSAYDLELGLRKEEVPPFQLHRTHGPHLGWTSFLERRGQHLSPPVRIRVRL